jgi:hypothetical protein
MTENYRMSSKYKVELLSNGGARKTVYVEATDPSLAKQKAESITNAAAAARNSPYQYQAIYANQA